MSADKSPLLIPGKQKEGIDHKQHVVGRRRRASDITRIIGHLLTESESPITIAAVLKFERDPGIEVLRNTILERVKQIPRFRSKLVLNRKSGGYFEEVEIDVGYHFEVFGFNERVSSENFDRLVESCQAWPLSMDKPLWKVIHVPTLENGQSAAVFVINHAIGDGVSLVDTLMNIIIDNDGETSTNGVKRNSVVTKRSKPPQLTFGEKTRSFLYGIYEGLTIITWKGDKLNPLRFKGQSSKEKLVASGEETVSLKQVKEICKKINKDISVNDVLLANLTKMIATYMLEHETDPKKLGKVHAQFPFNTRKKDQAPRNEHGDPNNAFAYGIFRLALEKHENAEELILNVKKQIDLIKVSPASTIARAGLPIQIKTLPLNLILNLMQSFSNIGTCMLSNVPGPQSQVSIANVPIQRFEFYLFSVVQNYIGIFSYNGEISCTVNMDKKVGEDPKVLANLWSKCFHNMYQDICGGGEV